MPEKMYQTSFGPLLEADRILTGAGEAKLDTVGYVEMTLNHGSTKITEQVYIVAGASKLLLGVPAIRNLGLIADIPGSYSVKAVDVTQPTVNKENVVKEYPVLFTGLGKLKGEHVIHLRENATPFCLATPLLVPYRTASKRPNLTYLTEGKHARLFGCLPYYKLTRLHDCSASNVITTGHVRVSGT